MISSAARSALLVDLLVGDQASLLVARLLDDALGLALGLRQHLLALLDDPTSLLDLLGNRGPHLVEQVVDLLTVDAHLVRQRHGSCVVDQVVELVDQNEDVHLRGKAYSAGPDPAVTNVISAPLCKLLPTANVAVPARQSRQRRKRSISADATSSGTRSPRPRRRSPSP